MIFVFGSNKSGIHGAGSALYAKNFLGAKQGKGEGIHYSHAGTTYALPTKGLNISFMTLEEVKESVDTFLEFANRSKNQFKVTQVGCGLGGFTMWDIAPLFKDAPKNCQFDSAWEPVFDGLKITKRYWGTF